MTPDSLLRDIRAWHPLQDPLTWSEEHFDAHARALFERQFHSSPPLRRFYLGRGISPRDWPGYLGVPAVPTDVFKRVTLGPAVPSRVFRTSGTTLGARGVHGFADLRYYQASLHGPFLRFMLPEAAPMRILCLAPSAHDLPDSSLSFMLSEVFDRWDDGGGGFFVRPSDAGLQVDLDALVAALDTACSQGVPVMLLGTSFAYVALLEHGARSWRLPRGSRLMETGGFKGRSREISRATLHDLFHARLGIPRSHIVSEYSMTELSSQTYSDGLVGTLQGQTPTHRLYCPPWARVDVVDPISLVPLGEFGRQGLIRWTDLANLDSTIAVQTSDLGVVHEDGGVTLLGRATGAELRGCSLTIEELLETSG